MSLQLFPSMVLLLELFLGEGRVDLAVADLVDEELLFATMSLWNQVVLVNVDSSKLTATDRAILRFLDRLFFKVLLLLHSSG